MTFGPKSLKLNSRPVYCSQLYDNKGAEENGLWSSATIRTLFTDFRYTLLAEQLPFIQTASLLVKLSGHQKILQKIHARSTLSMLFMNGSSFRTALLLLKP